MAAAADDHGYDIVIDGIRRTYRDQLDIAEEAVRYFRRNSSEAEYLRTHGHAQLRWPLIRLGFATKKNPEPNRIRALVASS
jgi:hypothetical protein